MRKIEQEMLQAIANGDHWQKDNTTVFRSGEVWLHGSLVATVSNTTIMVNLHTLRKWPTPTTKSRLRALGVPVSTKDGVTYIGDHSIYDNPEVCAWAHTVDDGYLSYISNIHGVAL